MSAEAVVTYYDLATGEITQTARMMVDSDAQLVADIELNCGSEWGFVLGEYTSDEHRVVEGEVVAKPAKPGPWAIWSAGEWIDPRPEGHEAAEAAARLASARARASMSRLQFVMVAVTAGIIPVEDAPTAARGEIPPVMAGVFAAMSPADRTFAEIAWAGATVIDRLNPVILMLAAAMSITDAQLDIMFGVEA